MHGRNLSLGLKNKIYLSNFYGNSRKHDIVFFHLQSIIPKKNLPGGRAKHMSEHLKCVGSLKVTS